MLKIGNKFHLKGINKLHRVSQSTHRVTQQKICINMEMNVLSGKIIALCFKVHSNLGPGLLESIYKECLYYELLKIGYNVEKEKPMPIIYDGIKFDYGYRIDLLIEDKVVVELKAVEALNDVHLAQILTYLKLGNYKLGLLINFNVISLKNGIRRIIN